MNNKPIVIVRTVALVLGVVQLALGMGLWAGVDALTAVHIPVGVLFVLSLVTLAVLAARRKVATGLVVFSCVWAVVIPALGATQTSLLPGAAHWLVQVVHLAFGLIGIYLVTALAAKATSAKATAAGEPPATTVGR